MNTAVTSKRHYVDPAPFDPGKTEPVGAENESFYRASSWQLMWWKFRQHRLAMVGMALLGLFGLCVLFAEVISPYLPGERDTKYVTGAPMMPSSLIVVMSARGFRCSHHARRDIGAGFKQRKF